MSQHQPFSFRKSEELLEKATDLGIEIPFQQDLSPLFEGITLGNKRVVNRLAVQPMEGFDANRDGSPGELTLRRYLRFAAGGNGLIWFEATSVVPEGRSNPRQLWLQEKSADGFKRMVEETRRAAVKTFGVKHEIYCVLQLTHSGRYSRPEGKPLPQVALSNPYLNKKEENLLILSDGELDRLQEMFVDAARTAHQAGFDAVDIKACHGYLVNELLSAFERKNSRYGGVFQNRTHFLVDTIKKVHQEVPGIDLAVRLNAFDGIPYPYGFGVSKEESLDVDLAEPKTLIRRLIEEGCSLINITLGIPYLFPHLGRPFDRSLFGSPLPPEHPLEGISRFLTVTGKLQKEFPDVPMVGTGYSWLRRFLPYVGAAVLKQKEAAFIGLGRSSLAYPDAPKDLMREGTMSPKKVCIACSKCSELMRMGGNVGCVVRDKKIYGEQYKKLWQKRKKQ
jgi:2,4-dienoyl-CoA reductase (NADPH2)